MPLVTQARVEAYLDVSTALAARIVTLGLVKAETYLRLLKGDHWYDALVTTAAEEPAAGAGADTEAPTFTIYEPLEGDTVASPLRFRYDAADNVDLTHLCYRIDGGAYVDVPVAGGLPKKSVSVDVDFVIPNASPHTFSLLAEDAAGNRTTLDYDPVQIGEAFPAAVATVVGTGGGSSEGTAPLPPTVERLRAEEAEATLALYYALPQLNLRIDEAGGIQEVTYTDDGAGTKQQIRFASSDTIAAMRRDLLSQAKLLVEGDVRIEEDAESSLITAVGDLSSLSGWGVSAI